MPSLLRHSGLLIHADRPVQFYADESLASAVLAEDSTVDGVPCLGGDEVEFHRGGRLAAATLAHDALVRGLPARGGGPLAFHRDGSPRFLVLARARRFHGFPAAPGSLFLHEDGSPWNALAAADVVVDGLDLAAGTRLTLDADGALREWWTLLQVDAEIQGLPCSARFPVWRRRDGSLSCLHLAQPCTIEGRRLPWQTEVLLDPDGGLIAARKRRYPRGSPPPWRVLGAVEDPLHA